MKTNQLEIFEEVIDVNPGSCSAGSDADGSNVDLFYDDVEFDDDFGYVSRSLAPVLVNRVSRYPIAMVSGPRGSGKSGLCRELFSAHIRLSLCSREVRAGLEGNLIDLLNRFGSNIHFDDADSAPELLLRALCEENDHDIKPGSIIISGTVSKPWQSRFSTELGNQLSILHLPEIHYAEEWSRMEAEVDLFTTLWRGSSFAIREPFRDHTAEFQKRLDALCKRAKPARFRSTTFESFARLVAGRTATCINALELSEETGLDRRHVRAWLQLMEDEYWICRIPPADFGLPHRQWKKDKVFFLNTGLACFMLGIKSPVQLRYFPLLSTIFETWIVSEMVKMKWNKGLEPGMSYLQNSRRKVGVVVEHGRKMTMIDTRPGPFLNSRVAKRNQRFLRRMSERSEVKQNVTLRIFTGGERRIRVDGVTVDGWRSVRFAKNWW